MKKCNTLLVGLILLTVFSSCGTKKKEAEVPQKVKDALIKHFPDATDISWDKETAFEWEADFRMYQNKYSANFDIDGNMLLMEYDIKVEDLPPTVTTAIDSTFEGYKIHKAERGEKGDQHFFEIELVKQEKTIEVVYDETGTQLNNEDRNKELSGSEQD